MLGRRNKDGTDAGTRREHAQTSREIARRVHDDGREDEGQRSIAPASELPETESLAGGGHSWHGPPVKLEVDLLPQHDDSRGRTLQHPRRPRSSPPQGSLRTVSVACFKSHEHVAVQRLINIDALRANTIEPSTPLQLNSPL
jgi:hypothetical protein